MRGGARTGAVLALLLLVARSTPAKPRANLDGSWQGTITPDGGGASGAVASTLTQDRARIGGTMTLDAGDVHGTFAIVGQARKTVRVRGRLGRARLAWRAVPNGDQSAWSGPIRVRGGGRTMRGVLALARGTARCGDAYFASEVMPKVLEPICAECHVQGGLASTAPFRVTKGDPVATVLSAIREVDPADVLQSKILRKPMADLPHGGGKRITSGSAEERILVEWLTRLTAPGCDTTGGGPGNPDTGEGLYAANCASCHGTDARGLDGRPDVRCHRSIHDAVRAGRTGPSGTMPAFANLTDAEIAKIQAYLAGLCPITSVTGAELYASNCATCHGADATGAGGRPSVRCSLDPGDAVRNGRGTAMPAFPFTDAEIALVAGYLDGLCTAAGRTGIDLFAGNCATCHGDDATGGTNALGVQGSDVQCNRGIADPVRSGKDAMPAFPGISDADLVAIQQRLLALCPAGSVTGAALYVANCSSCHGPDAGGAGAAPNVRCATRVADAVEVGRAAAMPRFGAMGAGEVGALATYLGQVCTQYGRTGAALWAGNCSTCHGANARGGQNALGVRGPDVACTGSNDYQEKVAFGDDNMPAFPALTGDVGTIVTYVHGAFCPGG